MLPCASAVCTSDPSCGSAPGHHSSHRGTHQEQHAYAQRKEVTLTMGVRSTEVTLTMGVRPMCMVLGPDLPLGTRLKSTMPSTLYL